MSTWVLRGRRVELRPLVASDWPAWSEVRSRCRDWLVPWEPRLPPGFPDPATDPAVFAQRCALRDRERDLGVAFAFGLFVDDRFVGEVNLNAVQRGAFQNAYIGYWVDQACAGRGYVPEAVVVLFRFAFETLGLHRIQISIVPRNRASRRVAEKLALRDEGIAKRYIEINGVWEDHVRYALTAEEWWERREAYLTAWIGPSATARVSEGRLRAWGPR
jgi:ribosomal-protein-alanine N-acetyltransferase